MRKDEKGRLIGFRDDEGWSVMDSASSRGGGEAERTTAGRRLAAVGLHASLMYAASRVRRDRIATLSPRPPPPPNYAVYLFHLDGGLSADAH